MIEIRDEQPGDLDAIRIVNQQAFGQVQEANIVDALRMNGGVLLSLVAHDGDQIVGHILYSPIDVGGVSGAALGPMAVVPGRQREGIGSRLVAEGTARLKNMGVPFIIVLGHPPFYPRFGFRPASAYGITCEWPVPDEVFMALFLDERRATNAIGRARYRPEFSSVL